MRVAPLLATVEHDQPASIAAISQKPLKISASSAEIQGPAVKSHSTMKRELKGSPAAPMALEAGEVLPTSARILLVLASMTSHIC